MPLLSWRHHTLIQALQSRGPLSEDDFFSIFSQVTGKSSGSKQQQQKQHLFNEFLRKINAELSYFQLELRACRNQYEGNVYYGVVNNISDDQSKLGTKYTVPQIAFYKGIVEAIIHDPEDGGCIFNTDALNVHLDAQVHGVADSESKRGAVQIPAAFKNFSMSQKEKTLEQLVKDQWLCSTPDGKIGIGVRSFLDLRSWFRTNEVPACEVCNEAAIKGERVCPGCGAQWPGSTVKAEAVEKANDPDVDSQPTEPSMKRRRGQRHEADRDDNAGSEPDSFAKSDVKRVTRRSARLNDH